MVWPLVGKLALAGAPFIAKKVGGVFGIGEDDKSDDKNSDKDVGEGQQGQEPGGPVAPALQAQQQPPNAQYAAPPQTIPTGYTSPVMPMSMVAAYPPVYQSGYPMPVAGAPSPYQTGAQTGQTVGPTITASEPEAAPPEKVERFAGTNDGMGKSLLKSGLAALAGGAAAAKVASADGAEGFSLVKKVMAGAGAGVFTKMGHESIAKEGGGASAGLNTGIASALTSTIKDGGPGMFSSAAMGFGSGAVGNALHDKLEREGEGGKADLVSGGLQGGMLGYALEGDMKGAGIFGAGGAGLSGLLGAGDRAGGLGDLVAKVKESGLGSLADVETTPTTTKSADGPEMG